MTLTIPDAILKEARLSKQEALLEFACRLFDAGKVSLWSAARMAGKSRVEFEGALHDRRIPVYRPTVKDLEEDLRSLKASGK